MALARTLIAVLCCIAAIYIANFAWDVNGYTEDYGSTPLNTLPFAIPWTLATIALVVVTLAAITSPARVEPFSKYALEIAAIMAVVLVISAAAVLALA